MVDISSQNNKINVTVSSSGNTANTNVTPDYAQYYSEKSREWATSNKIVDNTDYSSKYYANESKKQADISTAKTTEVVESGNIAVSNIESARDNAIFDVNTAGATQVALATEQATIATNKASEVVESGNTALSNIDTAKNNAITSIANQETTSKTSLIDEGATQIGLIQNEGATQVANVQSTGFYMRDDKLYYINSQGEETEFKLDELANKLDLDATNLNTAGKTYIAELSFPSTKAVDVNLLASGSTYTAPANGWFAICGHFGNITGALGMLNTTSLLCAQDKANDGDWSCLVSLKASKGDNVVIRYSINPLLSAAGGTPYFKFVYAKGDE